MNVIVQYLETGITLTTPIFFFIVLIALLRVLRSMHVCTKMLFSVMKKVEQIEKEHLRANQIRIESQLSLEQLKDTKD